MNTPVYGQFLIPIHPYDFYDLTKSGSLKFPVGETGIPVMQKDGTCYLSSASIFDYEGKLYLVSTSFKPSPDNSIVSEFSKRGINILEDKKCQVEE